MVNPRHEVAVISAVGAVVLIGTGWMDVAPVAKWIRGRLRLERWGTLDSLCAERGTRYNDRVSLILEITPDLERLLEAEASRTGGSPASVAHDMLRKSLSRRIPTADAAPRLTADESALFEEINQGPSGAEMDRYLTLIRARQEESIGEAGLEELRAFTHRMEQLAVHRLTSLAALARLRGVDLEDLMDELQIQPPDVL